MTRIEVLDLSCGVAVVAGDVTAGVLGRMIDENVFRLNQIAREAGVVDASTLRAWEAGHAELVLAYFNVQHDVHQGDRKAPRGMEIFALRWLW